MCVHDYCWISQLLGCPRSTKSVWNVLPVFACSVLTHHSLSGIKYGFNVSSFPSLFRVAGSHWFSFIPSCKVKPINDWAEDILIHPYYKVLDATKNSNRGQTFYVFWNGVKIIPVSFEKRSEHKELCSLLSMIFFLLFRNFIKNTFLGGNTWVLMLKACTISFTSQTILMKWVPPTFF